MHGADFLACVLCVEPFGHKADFLACVLCTRAICAWS